MDIRHAKLISAMTEYDAGDTARIQHFIKVHDFAAAIAVSENVDAKTLFILETAAILHDIGIHVSEKIAAASIRRLKDRPKQGNSWKNSADIRRNKPKGFVFL